MHSSSSVFEPRGISRIGRVLRHTGRVLRRIGRVLGVCYGRVLPHLCYGLHDVGTGVSLVSIRRLKIYFLRVDR